ncbi:MAG: hypothetical protein MJE77_30355 [Proteobacteria bacterium]|nr:hypothetical protein [Pseudomonadota bacterium]
MKNLFDQLTKAILTAVLDSVTQLETNYEIRGHALVADVWVEPDPEHESDLKALGVLGRMLDLGPCLIEPYSGVPRASEIHSCILKQYSLNHARRRDARAEGKPAPSFPRLWVIATGSPDSVIEEMELRQMVDWPEGLFCGRPFDPFHLLVVRKLPITPETLLVRFMGRGDTFREAVRELAEVPETDPSLAKVAERVMRVLVVFGKELNHDELKETDMEALQDIEAAYTEWKRQVRAEANRETLIDMIRSLCQRFEVELTDKRLAQLASWDADQLKELSLEISASHKWPGS